ncbi:pyrroline-5-carboxylate reductase [Methanofollis aquaemaris]|uniref:Pyrroline-5-carboxylate reductase n=1 Tax=Methanofollis aquaemaris TaxID=126734 RepID=A0A8A3S3R4_9EURY|nr:NAD(P)-binding domain-containing protein [Methanofollis aquaemaris]QSZ66244.1 pyrroline-5-carboxylate reductase [Methanofollis aquaemaris]
MTQIGVIGTGSMGSMLVRAFIKSGAAAPEEVIAYNRSTKRAAALSQETGIRLGTCREVAAGAGIVFLCVRPHEVEGVLRELGDTLSPRTLLVSIAAEVPLADLQAWTGARVVRVIPTLTSEILKGASLVVFGERATSTDRDLVRTLMDAIGRAVEVEEEAFELLTLLTSCGPAFIAATMKEFAAAAVRRGGVSPACADLLVTETLAGTAGLLEEEGSSFDEVISRVATEGGITAKGVAVIRKEGPGVFDAVVAAALGEDE